MALAPRSAGSDVRIAARSRNAAAAATPPLLWARPAEASSSAATASSGPVAALAACQARRSGSDCGSVTSANARWIVPAIGQFGGAVGGRAHQRMVKAHARAELDHSRGFGGSQRVDRNAQLRCGAEEQRGVADRFGGGDQQQSLGLLGKRLDATDELFLDCRRRRALARISRTRRPSSVAVTLRGTSRMASGTPRVSATMRSRTRGSIPPNITDSSRSRASPSDSPSIDQFRKPGQRLGAVVAGREDQCDRLGQQPSGDEGKCLHRHLVEPLRVVDDAEQRLIGSGGGHQAQHGQPDQESVRRRSATAAECDVQRFALGFRKFVEVIEQRRAQLLQTGEGEFHIGLDARHVDTAESGRLLRDVLQQCGLADARLAAEHQHLAASRSDGRYQTPKRLAFAVATAKTIPRPWLDIGSTASFCSDLTGLHRRRSGSTGVTPVRQLLTPSRRSGCRRASHPRRAPGWSRRSGHPSSPRSDRGRPRVSRRGRQAPCA